MYSMAKRDEPTSRLLLMAVIDSVLYEIFYDPYMTWCSWEYTLLVNGVAVSSGNRLADAWQTVVDGWWIPDDSGGWNDWEGPPKPEYREIDLEALDEMERGL